MVTAFSLSSAFFDLSPEERGAAYESAERRYGVESFWDLDPEQRAEAYDRALNHAYGGDDDH